jgi:hypothetical protein
MRLVPRHRAGRWLFGALGALLSAQVSAQGSFPAGSHVQASPIMLDGYWQDCVVVSGPDERANYRLDCTGSVVTVPVRWIRPAAPGHSKGPSPGPARPAGGSTGLSSSSSAGFAPGSTVLASPLQLASSWRRCQVRSGPGASGYYSLDCADDHAGTDGKMKRTVRTVSVPGQWIKADDPSFRPDMQVGSARAEAARDAAPRPTSAPPPANGAASAVAAGSYECWAFNTSRMNLNFQVTGPGAYRASDGSSGRFTFDAASKRIQFTGYLAEAMPDGFTAIYHEPKGMPTVSFRGRGGAEASFCERK